MLRDASWIALFLAFLLCADMAYVNASRLKRVGRKILMVGIAGECIFDLRLCGPYL